MAKDNEFEQLLKYSTHERGPFFEIAREFCDATRPCLDIGAGNGEFADLVGRADMHLIEGNPETAERLRSRYRNVHELSLPSRLPFDDGYFGLIHSSHVIEHFYPEQLYAVLAEIDRCLAIGGHVVISTPLMWEGFYDDLSHIKPYTPVVLRRYLCEQSVAKVTQRTRGTISSDYQEVRLVYRYRKAPLPLITISYSKRWLQRFAFVMSSWLRTIDFFQYERTGYTIVLRKAAAR